MHLTLHTATLSKNHYLLFDLQNIKINENAQQFLSQMDYEKCTFATWLKLRLIMGLQKSL